ncbi:MAG TPA: TetR/AcrR family transcriptional regulator [Stackebrandtia sp.]|jgi:AcrR family transcriptional regulator|uniref:TetR/AcrR family transcriptional regulator n=1 Tax=Stackebrandtia sp. TaxID=2023065 RepID=UPI002D473E63|nr:TetR/AcrR family transcriptional regulator [Stackebrandtia sp.]HZE41925.1 TetR/AcrR family transcriptional regulator [Stackebrandtia sp.]
MSVTAEPGTQRPGGRTARVRAAVLDATRDELVERGFHDLNLEAVARRANVGKTTVYRRWGGAAGLVADLLADLDAQSTVLPDTGDIAENMAAQAASVLNALTDARLGRTFKAVIAAATCDERTARALHDFHASRIAAWAAIYDRAVERGELPDGTDTSELVRAVAAPLYYRFTVIQEPIDSRSARRAVDAALAAARAGAFARR